MGHIIRTDQARSREAHSKALLIIQNKYSNKRGYY